MDDFRAQRNLEEWRKALGFGCSYEVSSLGRVRRSTGHTLGRCLAQHMDRKGRMRVCLNSGERFQSYLVHRVVAAAFLGECPQGFEVNHIDGNRTNNRAENLEYLTSYANYLHSVENNLNHRNKPKLNPEQVREIRLLYGTASGQEVAKRYGVSGGSIRNLWSGRSWKHVV
jgi:hypothetical protein